MENCPGKEGEEKKGRHNGSMSTVLNLSTSVCLFLVKLCQVQDQKANRQTNKNVLPIDSAHMLPTMQSLRNTCLFVWMIQEYAGNISSGGRSGIPICQGCGFDLQSGPKQESTNECIKKWNNKSMSLFHTHLPLSKKKLRVR